MGASENERDARRKLSKSFQPGIGKPFHLQAGLEFSIDQVAIADVQTKGFLVRFVCFVGIIGFVTVPGIYGLWTGNYAPLQAVWNVLSVFVGMIFNHYFGGRRKDTE